MYNILCGSKITLNPRFNRDKIWRQANKNRSLTPCKILTK